VPGFLAVKWFHFSIDTSVPGPVWAGLFWQARNLLEKTVDLVPLSLPIAMASNQGQPRYSLRHQLALRTTSRELRDLVERELSSSDQNVLEVQGTSAAVIHRSSLLDPIWDRFYKRVLTIVDTIEPEHVPRSKTQQFDLIRCFCPALARRWRSQTSVPVLFQPSGIDAVEFLNDGEHRPIDMIVVGRRDREFYQTVHQHYLPPERGRLLLDFGTRPQGARQPEEEWRLLMSAYARAQIAFCFEPSSTERFKGRSSMTHRWPQAWTAGCTVIGRGPTEPELQPYLDWPESTLEVPDDPNAWIPFLETTLQDSEGLQRRRERNTLEALRRHDARLHLRNLLFVLGLERPTKLRAELERLEAQVSKLEEVHGLPALDDGWERVAAAGDQWIVGGGINTNSGVKNPTTRHSTDLEIPTTSGSPPWT
jgi:hypothetical protein